jgi:ABC-2 type transport system permease protein
MIAINLNPIKKYKRGNMSFKDDLAVIQVLWKRDLLRFFRKPSRLVGAFLQPVIFWFMIGSGFASTFKLGNTTLSYEEYFYPGVLMMMVLFASIFGTITVIEDRHEGFLQSILVAPGSRLSLVIGKSLGVSSVGLIQGLAFLAFLPLSNISYAQVDWLYLFTFLILSAVALSAFGFFLAWWLDSSQAYHAIMSIILIPSWILSGAMFPVSDKQVVISYLMKFNPMTYFVEGIRLSFYPTGIPQEIQLLPSIHYHLLLMIIFASIALFLAQAMVSRKK